MYFSYSHSCYVHDIFLMILMVMTGKVLQHLSCGLIQRDLIKAGVFFTFQRSASGFLLGLDHLTLGGGGGEKGRKNWLVQEFFLTGQ